MLYVITGANGFIASSLVKHLVAQGHNVCGTVRDASKDGEHLAALGATAVEVKNLANTEELAKVFEKADGVFHMAAVHPEYGFADTPEGREGMLKAAPAGVGVSLLLKRRRDDPDA